MSPIVLATPRTPMQRRAEKRFAGKPRTCLGFLRFWSISGVSINDSFKIFAYNFAEFFLTILVIIIHTRTYNLHRSEK